MSFDNEVLEDQQFEGQLEVPDQTATSMKDVLSGLPSHYQNALWLHGQGYKYREIATILDININTVKSRIRRGRKHL